MLCIGKDAFAGWRNCLMYSIKNEEHYPIPEFKFRCPLLILYTNPFHAVSFASLTEETFVCKHDLLMIQHVMVQKM